MSQVSFIRRLAVRPLYLCLLASVASMTTALGACSSSNGELPRTVGFDQGPALPARSVVLWLGRQCGTSSTTSQRGSKGGTCDHLRSPSPSKSSIVSVSLSRAL